MQLIGTEKAAFSRMDVAFWLHECPVGCEKKREEEPFFILCQLSSLAFSRFLPLFERYLQTIMQKDAEGRRNIHLIPKWRPINYSFVCMLISP